jgi:hypothetical protein
MISLLFLMLVQGAEEGEYAGTWPVDMPKELPVKHYLPFPAGKQYSTLQSPHTAPTNRYAIDFAMPMNSPVCASADGVVMKIDESGPNTGGKTNQIILKHADGSLTCYLHLANKGAIVRLGDFVYQGDVIGYSGASGTQVPHTHYSQNKANLECLQPVFQEGSDPNRWISQNESFTAKYQYARAGFLLTWGPKFGFWNLASGAMKGIQKPTHSRLLPKFEALSKQAEAFEAQRAAFLKDGDAEIGLIEFKGTAHEEAFKSRADVKKLKVVEARRAALKQAFERDLKSGDTKGYESFLQRFKDAPEAAAIRERLR